MRLLFAGTPEAAVPSLQALAASRHDVVAVLTQPDAPGKRGSRLIESPVAAAAHDLGIPVFKFDSAKSSEAIDAIRALNVDAAAVVAYGQILTAPMLATAARGFFNLHFSLLPEYRGAAPLQRAIEAGNTSSGMTVFRLDEGMDTGPIALTESIDIPPTATSGEMLDTMAHRGAALLVSAMDRLADGTLALTDQDSAGSSHASKLSPAEGSIDPFRDVSRVSGHIRAFAPNPGAYMSLNGTRIKVLGVGEAAAPEGHEWRTGAVSATKKHVFLGCADGPLNITVVQPAGKRAMRAADWARGAHITAPVPLDAASVPVNPEEMTA